MPRSGRGDSVEALGRFVPPKPMASGFRTVLAVTDSDHRRLTRTGYDIVAEEYAILIPDLSAETSLDVAMIDDFAGRCRHAPMGPVADVGCGTGRVAAHLAARGVDVFGVDLPRA